MDDRDIVPCPVCQRPVVQIRPVGATQIEYLHTPTERCLEDFARSATRDVVLARAIPASWIPEMP